MKRRKREDRERETKIEKKRVASGAGATCRDKSVAVRGARTVPGSVNNNIEIHVAHSGGGQPSACHTDWPNPSRGAEQS